jgi:hypothetical protein
MLIDELAELNPDALLADGFEAALIGYTNINPVRAVYDTEKCLLILVEQGMTVDEAFEYLGFNVFGAYVGENGPLFVTVRNDM